MGINLEINYKQQMNLAILSNNIYNFQMKYSFPIQNFSPL